MKSHKNFLKNNLPMSLNYQIHRNTDHNQSFQIYLAEDLEHIFLHKLKKKKRIIKNTAHCL